MNQAQLTGLRKATTEMLHTGLWEIWAYDSTARAIVRVMKDQTFEQAKTRQSGWAYSHIRPQIAK